VIVLAGDVGGTNARLATVELNGGGARILHQRVYRSRDYTALPPLVRGVCRELPSVPRRACFGLAGPVVDQECIATNLPWTVAVDTLGEEIGIPATTLTNDLVATDSSCSGPPISLRSRPASPCLAVRSV
jgi:glucokinase